MPLTGKQLIGQQESANSEQQFQAINPQSGESLTPQVYESTPAEVNAAVQLAEQAFNAYRNISAESRAAFLDAIADEIMALDDDLIQRAMQETALPEGRLKGERGRTVNQLRLFAEVVREGSWVQARIDTARPDRTPIPKSDIRQMPCSPGTGSHLWSQQFPVGFFCGWRRYRISPCCWMHNCSQRTSGSSWYLRICRESYPESSPKTGMPEGVFSLLQGAGHEVGKAMVQHPLIKAVGFTGSYRGGKALFDAANQRPEPIPVYAEMGSTNPVFILPGALKSRASQIAAGLTKSVCLGVGQFCTNPGLVLGMASPEMEGLIAETGSLLSESQAGTMLSPGIQSAYQKGIAELQQMPGVKQIAEGPASGTAATAQSYASSRMLKPC